MPLNRLLAAFALAVLAVLPLPAAAQAPGSAPALDPQNTVYMDIAAGRVVIKLRPDLAPNHVARVKELIKRHFYDGTPFHRVIPGFMAQGGDPTGTGSGGSDLPDLKAEFTKTPFVRGVIGAARTDNPNSANSQFYIMFDRADWLDGKYTVWGEVVQGMEFVDKIKKGSGQGGIVSGPDKIIKMQLAADAK
jgi:peptidylprolyl isomerase